MIIAADTENTMTSEEAVKMNSPKEKIFFLP